MNKTAFHTSRGGGIFKASLWSFLPLLFLVGISFGCSSKSLEGSAKGGKVKVSQSEKAIEKAGELKRSSPAKGLRAWVNAIRMNPPLANKDDTIMAKVDWGPKGQPGIRVVYQWYVNGIEIEREMDTISSQNTLPLNKFRSGDRVFLIASLLRSDGSVADSQRSISRIIQNRAPVMESTFWGFEKDGEFLRGKVVFSDPDGDEVEVELIRGPKGLRVQGDGQVFWPLEQVTPGDHQLVLDLKDEKGLGFRGTLSFSMEKNG